MKPHEVKFLNDPPRGDPTDMPAPWTMGPLPDMSSSQQWVLKIPDPNVWHRFWTRVLLGWRWERR